MPDLLPIKTKSSKMLAVLYIYSKQLQLLDEELDRVKGDQNIATCRPEYIQGIWGEKLGQPFTSDFTIAKYRQLLLSLIQVSLQDSTKKNIKDTIRVYFPDIEIERDITDEIYIYSENYLFLNQPVISITKVEVDSGSGYKIRPLTDYYLLKDLSANENTAIATDKLQFINNKPEVGVDSVRVSYKYDSLYINVIEYWKNPELMLGYDWQNKSFLWRGAGDTPIVGNEWNANRYWIPDLKGLGYFLFGVQIQLRGLSVDDVNKVETYVIPALERFVRPAGVYYKTVAIGISMDVSYREKTPSTKEVIFVDSILGFGIQSFGSPLPHDGFGEGGYGVEPYGGIYNPSDFGFGSPSLP